MRGVSRLVMAVIALGTATSVTAQSFNHDLNRYRAARATCAEQFQNRVERPRNACIGQCRTQAEQARDRCLARAERAYGAALERALRIRR